MAEDVVTTMATGEAGATIEGTLGGCGVVAGVGWGAGDGVVGGWLDSRPGDSGGCRESSSMIRPWAWLW